MNNLQQPIPSQPYTIQPLTTLQSSSNNNPLQVATQPTPSPILHNSTSSNPTQLHLTILQNPLFHNQLIPLRTVHNPPLLTTQHFPTNPFPTHAFTTYSFANPSHLFSHPFLQYSSLHKPTPLQTHRFTIPPLHKPTPSQTHRFTNPPLHKPTPSQTYP